jgi:hypothetical protein
LFHAAGGPLLYAAPVADDHARTVRLGVALVTEIRRLKIDGTGATEIAKQLGIARASVYRALA